MGTIFGVARCKKVPPPEAPRFEKATRGSARSFCFPTVVCERSSPPEKRTGGKTSYQGTRSSGWTWFGMLLHRPQKGDQQRGIRPTSHSNVKGHFKALKSSLSDPTFRIPLWGTVIGFDIASIFRAQKPCWTRCLHLATCLRERFVFDRLDKVSVAI